MLNPYRETKPEEPPRKFSLFERYKFHLFPSSTIALAMSVLYSMKWIERDVTLGIETTWKNVILRFLLHFITIHIVVVFVLDQVRKKHEAI